MVDVSQGPCLFSNTETCVRVMLYLRNPGGVSKETGEAQGAGSRVCRIPRLAPATAAGREPGPERCRAIVGGPSPVRLSAGPPATAPASAALVDFFRTVARPARLSGAGVAVYRASYGPEKGTCRGGPARSTHARRTVTFLAESGPKRRNPDQNDNRIYSK